MKVQRGSTIGGRFEITGDVDAFRTARRWAEKGWHRFAEADLWLRGRDRRTGAPVLVELRHPAAFYWPANIAVEAAARRVATVTAAGVVPVPHVGDGVVYAEPPEGSPRGLAPCAGLRPHHP